MPTHFAAPTPQQIALGVLVVLVALYLARQFWQRTLAARAAAVASKVLARPPFPAESVPSDYVAGYVLELVKLNPTITRDQIVEAATRRHSPRDALIANQAQPQK